jgi:hypothetical protein
MMENYLSLADFSVVLAWTNNVRDAYNCCDAHAFCLWLALLEIY